MTNAEFQSKVANLEHALQAKMGLKGTSLRQRLRRAGRRLPKRLQRLGMVIAEAETLLTHPKLARQVDDKALNDAFSAFKTHLDKVDPADRRKGIILAWLAGFIIKLVIVAAIIFALLRFEGII